MIRSILIHPDPRLHEVSAPVPQAGMREVADLARDMLETMYDAPGRGLAAPQIGVMSRLFVMDCSWKDGPPDPRVFVNPEIVGAEGEQVGEEACLSIRDTTRRVVRPRRVVLSFDGHDGRRRGEAFEGVAAACVCHEVDHLDGRLILDHPAAP
jgi:peptide deformylase